MGGVPDQMAGMLCREILMRFRNRAKGKQRYRLGGRQCAGELGVSVNDGMDASPGNGLRRPDPEFGENPRRVGIDMPKWRD